LLPCEENDRRKDTGYESNYTSESGVNAASYGSNSKTGTNRGDANFGFFLADHAAPF
jgi:hypothetical protein